MAKLLPRNYNAFSVMNFVLCTSGSILHFTHSLFIVHIYIYVNRRKVQINGVA